MKLHHLAAVSLCLACGADSDGDVATTTDTGTETSTGGAQGDDTTEPDGDTTASPATSTGVGADTSDATSVGSESAVDTADSTGDPSVCGDGVQGGDEVCDDANTDDEDGCSADCSTATCLVPVTHDTIQAAHDDRGCPTVWILPGDYNENLTFNRDITVVRTGDGSDVVVDGSAAGTTLAVFDGIATVTELVITGGAAAQGAGVRNDGTLVLRNTTVRLNVADGADATGGGIFNSGTLTLDGGVVSENTVSGSGDDSAAEGAGLYSDGGTVILTGGATVSDNVAMHDGFVGGTARGGGLYTDGADVTIEDGAMITSNTAMVAGSFGSDKEPHIADGGGAFVRGGSLSITGASLTGNLSDAAGDGANNARGGGLYLDDVDALVVASSEIDDNEARAVGSSATARGAAIYLTNTVVQATLTGSTLDGNVATATPGAGKEVSGGAQGGAIYSASGDKVLTLTECSLSENTAQATIAGVEVGLAHGGAIQVSAATGVLEHRLVLDRSTLADNTAQSDGTARGGAVYANAGTGDAVVTVVVRNSTLSGNTADGGTGRGGAIYASTGSGNAVANVGLFSSTVTLNTATVEGGALFFDQGLPDSVLNAGMANTVLFGNMAPSGPECVVFGTDVGSMGFNLIGDVTDCPFVGATDDDLLAVSPELGPLAANGGPTLTHAIEGTSPAFDAGDPDGCVDENLVALTVDQRGEDRVASVACDVGAFELQP